MSKKGEKAFKFWSEPTKLYLNFYFNELYVLFT